MREQVKLIQDARIELLREVFQEILEIHTECLEKNVSTRHQIFCKILQHFDEKLNAELNRQKYSGNAKP
jgi:hypothetical protein